MRLTKIVVVDCCLGNLKSVQKALEKIHATALISNNESDLSDADAIVLPGVGAFRDAAKSIEPLKAVIRKQIVQGKPLLGICLGLQLLFTESTEGGLYKGLDVLEGQVVHFPEGLKAPHMGWNTVRIIDSTNPLVAGLSDEEYLYFVHSYYPEVKDRGNIVALTKYGVDFPSIVAKENVFATQFHPEKSGKTGLKILKNFLDYIRK